MKTRVRVRIGDVEIETSQQTRLATTLDLTRTIEAILPIVERVADSRPSETLSVDALALALARAMDGGRKP